MATVQLRLLMWLIVLCSMVAQVDGRGGSFRGGSSFRGSSRISITAGRTYYSSSSSGGSLKTGQIVGIVCGIVGGSIIIVLIPVLVKCICSRRRAPTAEPAVVQTVKYNCENSVIAPPPSYTDAVSDHPAPWTVTSPQLDPPKFPPPEPTAYGYPGDNQHGETTLPYPPVPTVYTPVNN